MIYLIQLPINKNKQVLTLEKELIYSSYEQLKNWFDHSDAI